jgi:hypothetical protein
MKAYPLHWPEGWERAATRKSAKFGKNVPGKGFVQLAVADSAARVNAELEQMDIAYDDIIISSNVQPRLDNRPRSGQKEPDDVGVAIYWKNAQGEWQCMALDSYDRVADNLAAIAATLEAFRAIKRHGGASILNRAFKGFVALPEPSRRAWWIILGTEETANEKEVEQAYRRMRSRAHPDNGGNEEWFNAVETAWQEFKTVRGI